MIVGLLRRRRRWLRHGCRLRLGRGLGRRLRRRYRRCRCRHRLGARRWRRGIRRWRRGRRDRRCRRIRLRERVWRGERLHRDHRDRQARATGASGPRAQHRSTRYADAAGPEKRHRRIVHAPAHPRMGPRALRAVRHGGLHPAAVQPQCSRPVHRDARDPCATMPVCRCTAMPASRCTATPSSSSAVRASVRPRVGARRARGPDPRCGTRCPAMPARRCTASPSSRPSVRDTSGRESARPRCYHCGQPRYRAADRLRACPQC